MKLHDLLTHPIIQGPMAGGASTPALIAAVSNAGGLGSLPISLLSPDLICEQVAQIRALTARPFQLNLFVQQTPHPSAQDIAEAAELLRPVWSRLGWSHLPIPSKWCEEFEAQFDVIVAERPAVASFTFDILSAGQVRRLHQAGVFVMGTVTTVPEALAWQAIGADAIIASGLEAGGHRGTFLAPQTEATAGAFDLLPAVVAAVDIPVICAGGIMDGAGILRALELGAAAVQMGTAFLVTDESGIHPAYKQRLLSPGDHRTRLTRAISGRYARGIENDLIRTLLPVEARLPPYPVLNALTTPIRAAAARDGDTELMSLWCGTGVNLARGMPAARLVATLVAEMRAGRQ
ncbi:MAG: nitronate monooxygenase [Pseudomonadota bacterium]